MIKKILLIFLFAFVWLTSGFSQSLATTDSVYLYYRGIDAPPTGWNTENFDDSQWKQGYKTIGWGDGDDSTVIEPCATVYLRLKFEYSNAWGCDEMSLLPDFDDGFVAYINGQIVAKANLNCSQNSPATFDQLTVRSHEAIGYRGVQTANPSYFISAGFINQYIHPGENVLAIEIHNDSINGSDLSFRCDLYPTYSSYYNIWWDAYKYINIVDLDSTRLPIIKIESDEFGIPRSHIEVAANMQVIYDSAKAYQKPTDKANQFDGRISIEIRGESSADFPKASYNIETQNLLGENLNVGLLGMPAENDWILSGPFADKSQIRNALVFDMGRIEGHYEPRYRFCEVIINGQFLGLYMLTEKIKQDKNRVAVKELNPDEISGVNLTGGYIFKYDKGPGGIQIVFPKENNIAQEQVDYLKNHWNEFYKVLKTNDGLNSEKGYKKYINDTSLVDYIIVNEITKNADGYLYSTYLYKDRDDIDPRVNYGPLWDYDLGFGNTIFQNGNLANGWQYEFNKQNLNIMRMLQDTNLVDLLQQRYWHFRHGEFSNQRIFARMDSMISLLEKPLQRNYQVWPVISKSLFFPNYVSTSYGDEITNFKTWMTNRLAWIDANIDKIYYKETIYQDISEITASSHFLVYPNPVVGLVINLEGVIKKPDNLFVSLVDISGKIVDSWKIENYETGNFHLVLPVNQAISKGVYFLSVNQKNDPPEVLKIIIP